MDSKSIEYVNSLYVQLNSDFFDGKLPEPLTLIVPSSRKYIHYTSSDSPRHKQGVVQVTISSACFSQSIVDIVSFLMHEMIHIYNDLIRNVQDTSRAGTYHNKFFAREATARGLIVDRDDKYGWSRTYPTQKLVDWALAHDRGNTKTSVFNGLFSSVQSTKRGNSKKYICTRCSTVIRATKMVNIICGDCGVQMLFVENDDDKYRYPHRTKPKQEIRAFNRLPDEMPFEDFMSYISQ